MNFVGIAHAAEAWAQDAAGQTGIQQIMASPIFLMIAMLGIFYFLLIRPQQKKAKEVKQMLANLQKGDLVFTVGGIHGKITAVAENTLTLEIADRVRVKINRGSVGGLLAKAEVMEKEKEAPKE